MRPIRAVGVTSALVVMMLGSLFTGVASAAVKGDVTNSFGNLVFHASGGTKKASGGFAVFNAPPGNYYFSGKVACYWQSADLTSATFVATITKPQMTPANFTRSGLLMERLTTRTHILTTKAGCARTPILGRHPWLLQLLRAAT